MPLGGAASWALPLRHQTVRNNVHPDLIIHNFTVYVGSSFKLGGISAPVASRHRYAAMSHMPRQGRRWVHEPLAGLQELPWLLSSRKAAVSWLQG